MLEKAGAVSATVPAVVGFEVCCVIKGYMRNMLKSDTFKSHFICIKQWGMGKRKVRREKESNLLAQIQTSPRIEMSDLKIPNEPACLICYHPSL